MSNHIYVSCDNSLPFVKVGAINHLKDSLSIGRAAFRPSPSSIIKAINAINEAKLHQINPGDSYDVCSSSWYNGTDTYLSFKMEFRGESFYAAFMSDKDSSWIARRDGIYKATHGKLWQVDGEKKATWFNKHGEEPHDFFRRSFLINDDQAYIYDMEQDKAIHGPMAVRDLGLGFDRIDAGIRIEALALLYVFSGTQYKIIDMHTREFKFGEMSRPIKATGKELSPNASMLERIIAATSSMFNFSSFPNMPFSSIDSAFSYNDKLYFFNGSQYARFDLIDETNGIYGLKDGYPYPIAGLWKGVEYPDIAGIISANNPKKVYFFKDNDYLRYDMEKDNVDPDYPMNTQRNWSGVDFNRITAAF